jgi:hypothetical protein
VALEMGGSNHLEALPHFARTAPRDNVPNAGAGCEWTARIDELHPHFQNFHRRISLRVGAFLWDANVNAQIQAQRRLKRCFPV